MSNRDFFAHLVITLDTQQTPPVISEVGIYSSSNLTLPNHCLTFEILTMRGKDFGEAVHGVLKTVVQFPQAYGWTVPFLTERHSEELEEIARTIQRGPIQ